jgi:flavin reductase (DIM6/NTAB) family NADH-FMN oxidoreductase RutF
MAKRPLNVSVVSRLLGHGPTVLVSCGCRAEANIITLAWTTPASIEPPMVAIAVAPQRHSHGLIERSGEFIVNIPGPRLLAAVWYCGTRSGRDGDKFAGAALTAAPAHALATPLVAECFAHIECRVAEAVRAGDHTLFVGEAVAASAEAGAFDGHLVLRGRFHTLHHLGGPRFLTSRGTLLNAR